MDVIIFCGGRGSRMSDETYDKPKPMIDIGDKPILWHIMKMYSNQGHKRFLLTLGYKGSVIQDWFEENIKEEDWNIEFIKTGINSEKGARLKRAEKYILSDNFHVTYGDGVSDININNLVEFHNSHIGEATMTVVRPPSRFGFVSLDGERVDEFEEKPQMQTGFINGGFFIFNKKVFKFIPKKSCMLEKEPMNKLAKKKELIAFKHKFFWQCMDTIRDKEILEKIWKSGKSKW